MPRLPKPIHLPANPLTPAIDHNWREHPFMPRAIAALIQMLAVEEVVASALESGEHEIAAGVLADSMRLRHEFEECYGIGAEVARDAFQMATLRCMENPQPGAAEGVYFGPLLRMLYRLGYSDGLFGHGLEGEPQPGRTLAQLAGEEPASEDERRAVDAVQLRVELSFYPSYYRGWAHGHAARRILESAPRFAQLAKAHIAAILRSKATPAAKARALRSDVPRRLRHAAAEARDRGAAPALLAAFVAAETTDARRAVARNRVARRISAPGGLSKLDALAEAARMTLRIERHQARPTDQWDRAALAAEQSERREALLHTAMWGFSASDVLEVAAAAVNLREAALRVTVGGQQDRAAARCSRNILLALGERLPPGLLRGAWSGAPFGAKAGSAGEPARPLSDADWRRLRDLEHSIFGVTGRHPSAAVAAELVHTLGHGHVARPDGGTAWGDAWRRQVHIALHDRAAPASARRYLALTDEAALRRVEAEAEVAGAGRLRDAEAGELWLRQYMNEWLEARGPSEAVELRARCQILEAALSARALREARGLVAGLMPACEVDTYLSAAFHTFLVRASQVARVGAARAILNVREEAPLFASRLLRHVDHAVLDRAARELKASEAVGFSAQT
jgi:hypothetical protein